MKPDVETIAKTLDAVNQRFYEAHHSAFDTTRQFGWPGWSQVLRCLPKTPRYVLDVGCGNGRFARFLDSENNPLGPPDGFLGLDRNQALLSYARSQTLSFSALWSPWSWTPHLSTQPEVKMDSAPQLVVAFGVLHHVYGAKQRATFLSWCGEQVAPGGYLAVSAWDFGRHPRYQKKCLSQAIVHRETGLDTTDLEPHDYFLGFGKSTLPMRYCHWVDDAESERLMALMAGSKPKFEIVLRLEHPDDLNRYWVWRRI